MKTTSLVICIMFLSAKQSFGLIDLTTYKPSNFIAPLVIGTSQLSSSATHNYTGPYYDNQLLYFNFGVIDIGTTQSPSFYTKVYISLPAVSEPGPWNYSCAALSANQANYDSLPTDQVFGYLPAGHYQLTVQVNSSNSVTESSTDNDSYTTLFDVFPAAKIGVNPTNYDFGAVQIGDGSDGILTVYNSGAGNISGTATTAPPFSLGANTNYSLGSNQSQNIVVFYTPTNSGSHTGAVHFSGGLGAVTTLTGTAFVAPQISVAPLAFDFGKVSVGSSLNTTFTIGNSGGGNFIGNASIPPPFAVVSGGHYNVSNQFASVVVSYTPTQASNDAAQLTFTGGGSTNVTVTGHSFVVPIKLSILKTNGGIGITWPSTMGMFILQGNASLTSTNWTNIPNTPTNQNGSNRLALPVSDASMYYRLLNTNSNQ